MNTVTANTIKLVRSLSEKKYRDSLGLFTVEGEKMVSEALKSDFEVKDVFRVDEIGEKTMSRMSHLSSPSPVLAVLAKPDLKENPASDGWHYGNGLFLALDSIKDPGNLGTILRIADWFGVSGVFASTDTVDIFNPKVVQATMGAIFRVKFHYCDIPALCRSAVAAKGNVYGTFLDGDNMYTSELNPGTDSPSMVIVGNEARGISPAVASCVNSRLFIPPYPADTRSSESLNAAVATAVTVAEFRRRTIK